jgi:hypothetical protein
MEELFTELMIPERDEKISLEKNKYDIVFVINLLRTIIKHCNCPGKYSKDFMFSLMRSLESLLSKLEVEYEQMKVKDTVVHLSCQQCGFVEPVFITKAKTWKCPTCEMKVNSIPKLNF